MLPIHHYSEPYQFLRDRWKAKKLVQPSFSMRAWSYRLGLKSNAPLSEMLMGKRPIPKRYVPLFAETLQLNPKESLYLETLLDLRREKNPKAQKYFLDRLKQLEPKTNFDIHEIESFRLLGSPLAMTILEMTELKDFVPKTSYIQNKLTQRHALKGIQDVVDLLFGLGLLKKMPTGDFKKTHTHLTNKPDVADLGTQEYHKNTSLLAIESLKNEPVEKREFNGYAININPKKIPRAKELLRNFIEEFAQEIEAKPQTGEQTYQLNLQFFPLTKESR